MNISSRKVSALTAGLSLCGIIANANTLGVAVVAQLGMQVMNQSGLAKFEEGKVALKYTRFKLRNEAEQFDKLTKDEAEDLNKHISDAQSKMGFDLFDAGIRASYDFGADNDEMFGVELGLRYFKTSHAVTFKDGHAPGADNTDKSKSGDNKKDDKKDNGNLTTGVDLGGIAADLSLRYIPLHFDGGKLVITLGMDTRINISKNFIEVKRSEKKDDNKNEDKSAFLGDDAQKTKMNDAISKFNIAGKLGLGATFIDDMLGVSVITRYWFVDQVDRESADIKLQDPAYSNLSAGKGLDINLGLSFNFMPLLA